MISLTGPGVAVRVASGGGAFAGVLELPPSARGMVLYAQADGPRYAAHVSRHLADQLRRADLASLQLDSHGADAARRPGRRFEFALLEARLLAASDWIAAEPRTRGLALGLFGTGAQAAAALRLAASRPGRIAAVVSHGGRPELAGPDALARIRAPTLLIVDEADSAAVERNRKALRRLDCEKDLALIPQASRTRGRQGAALEAARLAARWFQGYFGADARATTPPASPRA